MKKQNLLTLLSITTLSMSLICTPVSIYAKTISAEQYNTSLLASSEITIEPVIVFKGKSVTCGKELDRDMALEYLNKAKTSINFNDITVMVNVKEESSELIKGAILDLAKHDGETISLDYMHNGKVLKSLKLKVDCEEEEKVIVLLEGITEITENCDAFTREDALKFIDWSKTTVEKDDIAVIFYLHADSSSPTLEEGDTKNLEESEDIILKYVYIEDPSVMISLEGLAAKCPTVVTN